MGSSHSHLPSNVHQYADRVFDSLDQSMTGKIDRYQTLNLWLSPFQNKNAMSILDKVDKNNDGLITRKEWIDFWTHIYNSGYSEQEILNQLSLIEQQKGNHLRYRVIPGTTTVTQPITTAYSETVFPGTTTTTMSQGFVDPNVKIIQDPLNPNLGQQPGQGTYNQTHYGGI